MSQVVLLENVLWLDLIHIQVNISGKVTTVGRGWSLTNNQPIRKNLDDHIFFENKLSVKEKFASVGFRYVSNQVLIFVVNNFEVVSVYVFAIKLKIVIGARTHLKEARCFQLFGLFLDDFIIFE